MVTHPSILLIEDSPGECELFRLALIQTTFDVVLYTQHDADAALHFLQDRYHRSSIQACSYPLQEEGLNRSYTAHDIPPPQPSTSTGDRSGLPSLILLDLKLGRRNGCDFLIRLRADTRLSAIPVVVFTTSDDQTDLAHCYANGANGYVVKPSTYDKLVHCTGDICRYWLRWNRSLLTAETRC